MCGILGVVGTVPSEFAQTTALGLLRQRGPDSQGTMRLTTKDTDIWLGHTRLAVLDLSDAGHQPMHSSDGRWCVTFNGEIYNHVDIRKDLRRNWRGNSDTETLVEALATWGISETVRRLNGMFALAAVDLVDGRVYLVRDPFGVKPFYYSYDGRALGFSSTIKALAAVTQKKYVLDIDSLQTFLSLRFVPAPHTLLSGVLRVPAGHYVSLDLSSGKLTQQHYAVCSKEHFKGSVRDAVEHYHALLRQAVHRQMLSDVPVGILLSGGVDSAFVAAVAAERRNDIPCFSVGFGEEFRECELANAAETARVVGLPYTPVHVTQEELWKAFENCIAAVEEPLGTSSMLPMWYLSQCAHKNVTVVLTGQGSDEPWGGYRRYQAELWRRLPLVSLIARFTAPVITSIPHLPEFIKRAVDSVPIADMGSRFEREYCLLTARQRTELTGCPDYGRAVDVISYWLNAVAKNMHSDGAEAMMAIDSRMGLADDLLLYGDKVSMAHSLEARVPMLDNDLIKFVESLPRNYRVSLRQGKIVHKLAAEKYLPSCIVHRKKKGFPMPFGEWIRTSWRERVADVLFREGGCHLDSLHIAGLRRLWNEHQSKSHDHSRQLFALLAFAFWFKTMNCCIDGGDKTNRLSSLMDAKNANLVRSF